ncbi:hypothetical protein [Bacillus sinesaloumensis]|uniref:hypothetical protein n=1 Tax=Litchfieldia sinesaloumensis TaxID=1926280 RepID=UPI00098870A5|nr:hypothetical protein [Bacillus sinesaloumensis]
MNISKHELVKKLESNHGLGFVELNEVLYEIRLLSNYQIAFTGACWKWEQTEMSSAHGDYQVLTDVLVEDEPILVNFPNQDSYEFYETVNQYLS